VRYFAYFANSSTLSSPTKAKHVATPHAPPESLLSQPSALSFTDQLQGGFSDTSPPSTEFFISSPPFTFSASQMEAGVADRDSVGIYMPAGAVMDPFGNVEEGQDVGADMDMDDPVLHQLQTLAEGQDLGETLGQPQDLNIWEWFDMQQ
jgi:hypothetical protein